MVSLVGSYIRVVELIGCGCGTLHHFFDVDTRNSNRQQANRCQYGVTSADIVRDNERLIAFFGSQLLECALLFVGCSVNAFACFFLAVFLLQRCAEDTEGDSRFSCCTGFGDYVHGEVFAFHQIKQVRDICRADVVAGKINFWSLAAFFGKVIVEGMGQRLDSCACAQIRSADTNYDQYIGIALDLLGRLLNTGELFLVICGREIDPAQEIGACSCLVMQLLVGQFHRSCKIIDFMLVKEGKSFAVVKINLLRHRLW
ncbi:hypothetical protein D3C73_819290 [compost metagenome]